MDIYGIKDFSEARIGGRIKQKPEDFIVEEVTPEGRICKIKTSIFEKIFDLFPQKHKEYVHFTLVKKDFTTQRAINKIAEALRISSKRFGYAGTKDKRAITAQRISVWNKSIKELKKVKIKDLELKNFKYSDRRISLGDLKENRFLITIRDIEIPKREIEKKIEILKSKIKSGIPNYFGPQRFGVQRPINHLIGKNLLKSKFEEAIKIFITKIGDENENSRKARQFALTNWGKWNEILKIWPKNLGLESAVLNYLVKYPNDFANALRKLPKNLRRMFIHAVQSYIFNKLLTRLIEEKEVLPKTLPLIGYNTDTKERYGAMAEKLLENEGIKKEDFRLKSMPEIAEPGQQRKTKVEIKNLKVVCINDKILKISFVLGKGSYATIFLKVLLGEYKE